MATVRDVMTEDVECINEHASVREAARRMRDLDVGMLPVCDDKGELTGVATDRDIVVRCVADGSDTSATEIKEITDSDPITVMVDDDLDIALAAMQDNQVRRVLAYEDGDIAGVVALQDLANVLDPIEIGEITIAVTSEDGSAQPRQVAQQGTPQQETSQQEQALASGQ